MHLIAFLFFALPGALVLLHCAHQIRRGRASSSWPSTTGHVAPRFVSPTVFIRSDRRFAYTYTVGTRSFRGYRIWFGSDIGFAWPNPARTWLGLHYLPGAEVQVRYNPEDPRDSVLKVGISPGTYLLAGVAAVMLLLGLAGGLLA